MIDNNLDFEIAELVTYGETGQPCQNWLQYRLIKKYLEELTENQTLVVESGHPLGLFPSKPTAPRVIITNALMVGMFDNLKDWEIAEELGVANYGQMTAGGWIVHRIVQRSTQFSAQAENISALRNTVILRASCLYPPVSAA